jgi:hypothetical protein
MKPLFLIDVDACLAVNARSGTCQAAVVGKISLHAPQPGVRTGPQA